MAETNQILFDYKEVAEALIRKENLHEGLWGLYVEFGFGATNLRDDATKLLTPTALVAVRKIGIQRFPEENNLAVDAAKVNPPDRPASSKRSAKDR